MASPAAFRYRNRLSFTLRRLPGGRVAAGFHALARPGRIIDIDDSCLLGETTVTETWDDLRRGWGRNADRLPAGSTLRLTVRAEDDGTAALLIEGGTSPGRPRELLEAAPKLGSVWWRRSADSVALLADRRQQVTAREERSTTAFTQVNRGVAALLESHVLLAAGALAGRSVVEAYCGAGGLARHMASRGASVTGIELDPEALSEAGRDAPPGLTLERGKVEDLLEKHLPADLVIVDPPRAGLASCVAETLVARPPEGLIYVSCNPATLARDVRRLSPGFEPTAIRCFDMFPQTAEIETVAVLGRRPASGVREPGVPQA